MMMETGEAARKAKCIEIAKRFIEEQKKEPLDKYEFSYVGRTRVDPRLYAVDATVIDELKRDIAEGRLGLSDKSTQILIDLEKEAVATTLRFQ